MKIFKFLKSLITLFIVFFILSAFVRIYRVSDISMNYSLIDGDLVWVENITAGFHMPSWGFYIDKHILNREKGIHRGDLLAFRHPLDNRLYLKRCVALPGDSLFEKDKNLYLQIKSNSKDTYEYAHRYKLDLMNIKGEWWIKNPYEKYYKVIHDPNVIGPKELIDYPLTKISPHRYFLMGDYRDNSTDSRFFGSVPYNYIYYKVFWIWKLSRDLKALGSIRHYDEKHPLVIRKAY